MINNSDIDRVIGQDVYDLDGDKIGKAGQVYVDDQTGQPAWVTVQTGLFGTKESFVPLAEADLSRSGLRVPYSKAFVKDAPNLDADGHLSPEEEQDLYAYYGVGDTQQRVSDDAASSDRRDVNINAEADNRLDDDTEADDQAAMTVSEERVNVGTERREAGRVRLRKYVVTENVTQTVPVQREEVRLEREAVDPDDAAVATSTDITEDEQEVVLHEERPVVEKETVPVERVRVGTETVTDHETVNEQIRKERVDVDDDNVAGREPR